MSTTVSGTPEQPKAPQQKPLKKIGGRFEIKEGMGVKEVLAKGNAAQKAAATIFDYNGDGHYDYNEAYAFNNTRISADTEKGEIRLYKKDAPKDAKPTQTVNIETEKADYAMRTAKYQKFAQTLMRYGIDKGNAEWCGINSAEVKTANGKQVLVLKSDSDNYQLELPIDKNFDPSKIEMFRAKDEHNIHFNNINGTVRYLGKDVEFANKFAFGGNSNVTVIGVDGVADSAAVEDNATVKFKTGDFADTIEDRTRMRAEGEDDIPYTHPTTTHLKPGTTTVKGADKKTEGAN